MVMLKEKFREKVRDKMRLAGTAKLYAKVGLTRMTPIKAYRMLRYWILTHVFKKEIPWLIEFSITYVCQCTCKHCSVSNYFEEAKTRPAMSTEEIKNIMDQAVEIGIPKIDFFGGEPMIREDIVELVRYGESRGLYTSITSNALLLSREKVKELKKAGVSCINISIDSAADGEHDQLRGIPGTYQKAIDAFGFCHEEGIPTIFSTYITRRRIVGLKPGEKDDSPITGIIKLGRQVKATGLRILFPIISGEWVKKQEIELTEDEKRFVINTIDPSFVFIEGAYSVIGKHKVCQALGGRVINISPYGELQLCIAFTNKFGSLKEKPLKELILDMWDTPLYVKNKGSSCCSTEELQQVI